MRAHKLLTYVPPEIDVGDHPKRLFSPYHRIRRRLDAGDLHRVPTISDEALDDHIDSVLKSLYRYLLLHDEEKIPDDFFQRKLLSLNAFPLNGAFVYEIQVPGKRLVASFNTDDSDFQEKLESQLIIEANPTDFPNFAKTAYKSDGRTAFTSDDCLVTEHIDGIDLDQFLYRNKEYLPSFENLKKIFFGFFNFAKHGVQITDISCKQNFRIDQKSGELFIIDLTHNKFDLIDDDSRVKTQVLLIFFIAILESLLSLREDDFLSDSISDQATKLNHRKNYETRFYKALRELISENKLKINNQPINNDDILTALEALNLLGDGNLAILDRFFKNEKSKNRVSRILEYYQMSDLLRSFSKELSLNLQCRSN